MHFQISIFQTLLQLDNLWYKETIKNPQVISHSHFTLALYYFKTPPPVYCPLCINHTNSLFALYTPHNCPTMSYLSSSIFVPSCSFSPANSAGNTPYIVTSPPSESITSAMTSEHVWPNNQMVKHIATILSIIVVEVHHEFPASYSIMPIDIPPPILQHHIEILDTLPTYPDNKFIRVTNPSYPDSPPSSPKPLPVPPPYETMSQASPFDNHNMAVVLYDKLAAQEAIIKARDADTERQTPSPTGPQSGVYPGPRC